jgi:uncharacterized membrane protein
MTAAATAPSPWPGPPPSTPLLRFGRDISIGTPEAPRHALQWVLQRNCSTTPRQLMTVYASLCIVSLAIAAGFWWQGATLVLAFAGVELLLVGLALLVYARHAGDRETLTLADRALQVEQHFGGHVARTDFRAEWLSVEPAHGQGSLVELAGHGQRVRVGRFLRPELRGVFAHELRSALRRAR